MTTNNDYMIAREMMIHDIRNAGFEAVVNMNNAIRVSLLSRPITIDEIKIVMDDCGYNECQYELNKIYSFVIVTPVIIG